MSHLMLPSALTTILTALCLMVAALSLGVRCLLTAEKYPNYPTASKRQWVFMAALGISYGFLSVYRFNSPFHPGGFEIDAFGAGVSVLMAGYHGNEAFELLQSRLPAIIWARVRRAKDLAKCGRKRRARDKGPVSPGEAAAALILDGAAAAAPMERPEDTLDILPADTRRVLQVLSKVATAH